MKDGTDVIISPAAASNKPFEDTEGVLGEHLVFGLRIGLRFVGPVELSQ